jgi:hypothetical protein
MAEAHRSHLLSIFRVWPHRLTTKTQCWVQDEELEEIAAHDDQLSVSKILPETGSLSSVKDVMALSQ